MKTFNLFFKKISILLVFSIIVITMTACKEKEDPITEVTCDPGYHLENDKCIEDEVIIEPVTHTINEVIQALNSSVYIDDELNADFGLNDINNVGVNEEEASKILYSIDESSFVGEIIEFDSLTKEELVNAGVIDSSEEINLENDYERLLYNLQLAKKHNDDGSKALIKLPNRVINIKTDKVQNAIYSYVLVDYDGLYIKGEENTEFNIEIIDLKWKGFMNILDSKDIHFENIKLDYKISPVLSGVVTNTDDTLGTVEFKVEAEFNELVKRITLENPEILSYVEFDSIINAPRQGGNFLTHSSNGIKGYTVSGDETDGYYITVQFKESYLQWFTSPPKGDYVNLAFSMYVYNGFNIEYSEDIYFESVSIYTAPGMALRAEGNHNMYFNNFDIKLREGSSRIMTATADGLHFATCSGDIFINGGIYENTHDDALNIKSGYYYNLSDFDTVERKIILGKRTEAMPLPEAGDQIEIYDRATFELKAVLTIVSATGSENSYQVIVEESIGRLGIAEWDETVATFVSNIAKFEFTNNVVRNKRNRGILVQTRDALISNNHFENVGHGSISLLSVLDRFNEATVPRDMVVTNNKLINNNYLYGLFGDISVFSEASYPAPVGTITGIEISNNYITKNGNSAIFMQGVSNSNIENNLFFNVARTVQSEIYDSVINLTNSGTITIEGNYNYDVLSSESLSGIITAGLTNPETITLADNDKIKFQEVEGSEVIIEVPKIDGSLIIIDGDLSEWENIGVSIEMDGYSLATGVETSASLIGDIFKVKTAKFAWDDDGIYIVFDVKDDLIDFKTPNNFWVGDCVELFMSEITNLPTADMSLYKEDGGVLQGAFTYNWANEIAFGGSRTNSSIIQNGDLFEVKVIETNEGYSGEIYIPFTAVPEFKTAIDDDRTIAIAIVFADNDRPDGRTRIQVSNVRHFVEAYKTKTAKMPKYKFTD